LSVGAREFIPKQRVSINNDEALSTSRQNAGAQCLPIGPVSISTSGSRVASVVQCYPVALETIKGLRSAICKGTALPREELTFDGIPFHKTIIVQGFEETASETRIGTSVFDQCVPR